MDRPTCSVHPSRMASPPPRALAQSAQVTRPEINGSLVAPPDRPQVGDVCPPPSGTDFDKVGKNALVSAAAIGGCFGSATALSKAVHATPGMPLALKALAGLLPSASVFPTPWVEDGVRHALDTTPTYPSKPTLQHDAVAAGILYGFSRACARSALIPKLPPATPGGAAVTVIQASVASLLAGAGSEWTAQWMNQSERSKGSPAEPPHHIDNPRKATGRLLSQVPAAAFQTGMTLSGKSIPPHLSWLPTAIVSGGWAYRRVLIPAASSPNVEPTAVIVARSSDSLQRWGPSHIPPA